MPKLDASSKVFLVVQWVIVLYPYWPLSRVVLGKLKDVVKRVVVALCVECNVHPL